MSHRAVDASMQFVIRRGMRAGFSAIACLSAVILLRSQRPSGAQAQTTAPAW
ncbi:hypothetical protein ACFW5I_04040 [Streptomyces sp. NPDC058818]|uniref:hypothetical protein n=1 Tax=Streptomyces sp. NPDC058818 TaxID=3346640 RepID=UPI00369C613E